MHMKTTSQFVLAGVLALLAGTVAPAYAHQGQHPSEGKPPKQEHQAKPEKQHQDKDKQQKDQNKKPPHVQQPHQQQATQQGRRVPRDEQRTVWQQRRARSWEAEHRTWQQRGGYNGYRIPQDRYQR
jgi:DNA mismatch repair ATPase MutL